MGLSRDSYERIVNVLDECRSKIIAIAAEEKNVDQVYRMNFQLFPLTKKVATRESTEEISDENSAKENCHE
jgi:uncharacterized iron-regulated protein